MTCASGLPLPPHFLRACGRVSRPQPGDRFTLAGERAQLDTSHARNRRDVLVGDAQLDGVAYQRDPVLRLERELEVLGEPVSLDREDRNRVAHADQDERQAMLGRRDDDGVEKRPGLLQGLPVEKLAAKIARFGADAVPDAAVCRRRSVRRRTKLLHKRPSIFAFQKTESRAAASFTSSRGYISFSKGSTTHWVARSATQMGCGLIRASAATVSSVP